MPCKGAKGDKHGEVNGKRIVEEDSNYVVSIGVLPHKPVRAAHKWDVAFRLSGYPVDNEVCMLLVALWDGVGREGHGWGVHMLVDRHAVRSVGALT